jgi:Na+/melibiose symporter-like transporter
VSSDSGESLDIEPAGRQLVVRHIGKHEVIEVRVEELEAMRNEHGEVNTWLSFASWCAGILIPTAISWLVSFRGDGPLDPWVFAVHLAVVGPFLPLTIFAGVKWRKAKQKADAWFKRVKDSANMTSSHPIGRPQN